VYKLWWMTVGGPKYLVVLPQLQNITLPTILNSQSKTVCKQWTTVRGPMNKKNIMVTYFTRKTQLTE